MALPNASPKTSQFKSNLLKTILIALILILSCTWLVYRDSTQAPKLSNADFSGLDLQESVQAIADATVKGGAPGVVITVRKENQEFNATAGLANKVSGLEMSADMPLRIASVSKVYTATVVMSLVERGLIDLDSPIANYLNKNTIDGLPNAQQATVRQLLLHTSGIPDYYDLRSYFLQDWSTPITLERTLPVAKRGAAKFVAGEQYEYSNMGYILLGEIAKSVSGQSLSELIEQTIISPLGLKRTYYNIKHPTENGIHGYGTILRPWADTYDLWEHSGPDAGIMATASETAQFLEALTFETGALNPIGQNILAESLESGRRSEQTLGLEVLKTKNGTRLIGHTGDTFGYQTIAYSNPSNKTVFVASINCDCSALTVSLIRNLYLATQNTDG